MLYIYFFSQIYAVNCLLQHFRALYLLRGDTVRQGGVGGAGGSHGGQASGLIATERQSPRLPVDSIFMAKYLEVSEIVRNFAALYI